MSAVEFIAATGASQLGWAALTVLGDIAMAAGALAVLGAVCWLVFCALGLRSARGYPLSSVVDDEVGDDTIEMLRTWRDDNVTAELERLLDGGGGRG